MVQKLKGVEAKQKGREYRLAWPCILADAKALGAKATREKYGIPHTTWSGWMRKRADLAEAVKEPEPSAHVGTVATGANAETVSLAAPEVTSSIQVVVQPPTIDDVVGALLSKAVEYEVKAKSLREAARLVEAA